MKKHSDPRRISSLKGLPWSGLQVAWQELYKAIENLERDSAALIIYFG